MQSVSVQCYDKYLMKSLSKAAEIRGHTFWAKGPANAGSYNSKPHETGFFRDGGDYDSYYGRFFLNWYSQFLVDHGDRVLALANLAFEGSCIAAKVSAAANCVFGTDLDLSCFKIKLQANSLPHFVCYKELWLCFVFIPSYQAFIGGIKQLAMLLS